jgi:2',3'-cyclic-nucleotide 2'-phosphodiesterase (5'-nucleotidase family)
MGGGGVSRLPRARWVRRPAARLVVAGSLAVGASCARGDVELLFTADTEGRIHACPSCSTVGGLGDIARRATAIGQLRRDQPVLILVDAGNFLFGPDSIESGGRVTVAACDALRYDAVNLSYRDFRLGKAVSVALLRTARFTPVSANVIDESTGRPVAAPFVVKRAGAVRVAFVGVTELPSGVERLDHIATQLEGLRVRPPAEALAEWLPKARAVSDTAVLLFYGSAEGLADVRLRFGEQVAAILVGGLRPADLPDQTNPPVVATGQGGTCVAAIRLPAAGHAEVRQITIDGRFPPERRMLDLLKTIDGKAFDGGRTRPVM